MERFASLIYVFVVIAMVRSAKGDTVATECTLEVEEGKSKNDTLYEKATWCMATYEHMGRNPSTELIRETMTAYCAEGPKVHQCLEGLDEDARHCLDDIEQVRYRLYRQNEQIGFDVFCDRNEEEFVEYFRKQQEFYDNSVMRECRANATSQVGLTDTVNPNVFMLYTYKVMHEESVCVASHKGQGYDALIDWVITVNTKLMNRMKCVKDAADVLCKTIVDSH